MAATKLNPRIELCSADISVRLNGLELFCLDEWIERHEEPRPSRSEAIRRLMRAGLTEHPGQ